MMRSLAKAGDVSERILREGGDLTERRACKKIIEMDRMLFAQEHDYRTIFFQMKPWGISPKNSVIVCVPKEWNCEI